MIASAKVMAATERSRKTICICEKLQITIATSNMVDMAAGQNIRQPESSHNASSSSTAPKICKITMLESPTAAPHAKTNGGKYPTHEFGSPHALTAG